MFNRKLIKVQKEQIGALKSFYGRLAFAESLTFEKVSRFDEYITKLDANKVYLRVKKDERLLSIYIIRKLWLIANVYQKDLFFINKGLKAKVYIDGFDEAVISRVDYIYSTIDETNNSVNVRFFIDNKDLKYSPNTFPKVDIKQIKEST